MPALQDKVAVVTGASKGLGAAIAKTLARDGAAVIVNYAGDAKGAGAVASEIQSNGGRAVSLQADVSDSQQTRQLFDRAIEDFGQIDILVNNAGVYEFRTLGEIDEHHIERQFSINVKGLLFACREAARVFGDRGGTIINIGSLSARRPGPASAVYSATKAGVEAITKSLAAELAPRKILVNAILPGATETEGFNTRLAAAKDHLVSLIPLGRLGKPEEVANVVAFLASDQASWMTGELVGVGGGMGL